MESLGSTAANPSAPLEDGQVSGILQFVQAQALLAQMNKLLAAVNGLPFKSFHVDLMLYS